MLALILLGIVRNLVGVGSFFSLALSVGVGLSFMDIGWIRSAILLASLLPISFAGGLGVREVSLVALLAAFGVSAELALAFSFLLFVRGILVSLVGGLLEAVNVFYLERPPALDTVSKHMKES